MPKRKKKNLRRKLSNNNKYSINNKPTIAQKNKKQKILGLKTEFFKNIIFNLKDGRWRQEKYEEKEKKKKSSPFSLQVVNLEKSFGKTKILKGCNFSVEKGSFHALVGENGAGKTTLIKTIIGGYINYEGKIIFNGLDVKENIDEKSILSYVPEKATFPNSMNLWKYLMWLCKLENMDDNHSNKLIKQLLKRFDLLDRKKINPNKLSSGQKKKILLMKIIIEQPEIIILDEPAANLDPTARYIFFEELKKLNSEGKTIIITSHIIAEISKYIDSATFVKKGQIIFTGKLKKDELEEKFRDIVIQGKYDNGKEFADE